MSQAGKVLGAFVLGDFKFPNTRPTTLGVHHMTGTWLAKE